ncbi:SRPBCC domain-containing protein, partial [Streptosporangium sp. NPDC048865]|uniref:SRPBCC domain-containing protein n=1 Tax=Streptosporangium sp. NPDC048865 TaxID=3155766 RepID=UPI003422BDB1
RGRQHPSERHERQRRHRDEPEVGQRPALVTTVFDEQDGRTTMTTTVRYPSREARDSVLRTPMERGAGEAYDRLAEMLAETTGLDGEP